MFSVVVATDNKNGIGHEGKLPWPPIKADMAYFRKLTSEAETGKTNSVIMGRKTYESIPEKFRPLANRRNIVISSTMEKSDNPNLLVARDFPEALRLAGLNTRLVVDNNPADKDWQYLKVNPAANATLGVLNYLYQDKIEKATVSHNVNLATTKSELFLDPAVDKIFVIGGARVYQDAIDHPMCGRIYRTQINAEFECDVWMPKFDDKFELGMVDGPKKEGDHSFTFELYTRSI